MFPIATLTIIFILCYLILGRPFRFKLERSLWTDSPYGFRFGFYSTRRLKIIWVLLFYWRDKEGINRRDSPKC